MTAPKNMPTYVLRNMVENAEEQIVRWTREVKMDEEQLARAKRLRDGWIRDHASYMADLKEREAEEAE